ncbi:MAG: hypothetical protein ACR2RF_15380 [Geminicoccaceae bacterium]
MNRHEPVVTEHGVTEAEARRQHVGWHGDVGPDPEKADLLAALLDHAQCEAGNLGLHEIAYEMAMSRELGLKVVNGSHGFSILVPDAAGVRPRPMGFLPVVTTVR